MRGKKLFILLFFSLHIVCFYNALSQTEQTKISYISIRDTMFMNGKDEFKPLCINYLIDFAYDSLNNDYYISPHFNYSSIWGYPNTDYFHPRYYYSAIDERGAATLKLSNDIALVDSLGFNVVRIPTSIRWEDTALVIPTGSYEGYFALMDSFLHQLRQYDLRAILVLGADTIFYRKFDEYCAYLDTISRHFSNNATVMAYVVLAEPFDSWDYKTVNDKLLVSNWSRKWYYIIKNNAPRQLVSYGLQKPSTVITWDPSALTYDFLSLHLYHPSNDSSESQNAISSYLKWYHNNYNDIWMIAETGFSGTNDSITHWDETTGTEHAQYDFADFIMQRSLDCGCKGFSWWQYQDVEWCYNHPFFENHLGLLTYYPIQRRKIITNLFPTFFQRTQSGANCTQPINYYNINHYTHSSITGIIEDQNSNPLPDAIVFAWDSSWGKYYCTFSDNFGNYNLFTDTDTTLPRVCVSHYGYNTVCFTPHGTQQPTKLLQKINYNHWKKNWTAINYPCPNPFPVITNSDTLLVGNFTGDSADELVHIDFSNHSATLYDFNIDHWRELWTGNLGGWNLLGGDKFCVGDFNGDGIDEILCVQNLDNGWADIYQFDNTSQTNPWIYQWTNAGNGYIGTWQIKQGDVFIGGKFNDVVNYSLMCIDKNTRCKSMLQNLSTSGWNSLWSNVSWIGEWCIRNIDKYYKGDFDGDGKDELFCVQTTNGDSDWMTLLRYNSSWQRCWSNDGVSYGIGIYPYRNKLIVGNFDADVNDEILGIHTWATKFDFNLSIKIGIGLGVPIVKHIYLTGM